MSRNIEAFRLKTIIEVDNARANAALHSTVQKVEQLTGGFKGMLGSFSRESKESIEKVEGLSGSFGKLSSILPGLGGSLGIVGVGIGAIGTAAAGAFSALFALAQKSSEVGKSIFEIHEKSNLSTEAISAFRIAAEQTGIGIELAGNKLVGFNVALGKAQLGDKAMIKTFEDMGVSIHQGVEPALAQFMKKFEEMGPTAKRNALEAKIFRDRTGALIPLLAQLGGSLDEAKKRADELGLSFSETDAKSAKDFDDTLKLLGLQFKGVAEGISKEYAPEILGAMKSLSKGIKDNQATFREWGRDIADIFRGVTTIAKSEFGRALGELSAFSIEYLSGAGLIIRGLKALGAFKRGPEPGADAFGPGGPMREMPGEGKAYTTKYPTDVGETDPAAKASKHAAATRALIDPLGKLKQLYAEASLQAQFFGDKTERARVLMELQRAGIDKFTGKLLEQALVYKSLLLALADKKDIDKEVADETERQAKQQEDYTSKVTGFLNRQNEELGQLSGKQRTATDDVNDFLVALNATGHTLDSGKLALMQHNAVLIESAKKWEILRNAVTAAHAAMGTGGWSKENGKWQGFHEAVGNAASDAFAGGWKKVAPDGAEKSQIQGRWANMAQSFVGTFMGAFNSIDQGWKGFLSSLKTGFKSLLISMVTQLAESGIMSLLGIGSGLGGIGAAAPKKGFFGKLFGSSIFKTLFGIGMSLIPIPGLGALAHGAGGNPAHPGYRAFGGPVYRGRSYIVGEQRPELFQPTENGWTHPSASGGGMHPEHAQLLDRLSRALDRFESMPAHEVVRTGFRGVLNAMDGNAANTEAMGRRLRLA